MSWATRGPPGRPYWSAAAPKARRQTLGWIMGYVGPVVPLDDLTPMQTPLTTGGRSRVDRACSPSIQVAPRPLQVRMTARVHRSMAAVAARRAASWTFMYRLSSMARAQDEGAFEGDEDVVGPCLAVKFGRGSGRREGGAQQVGKSLTPAENCGPDRGGRPGLDEFPLGQRRDIQTVRLSGHQQLGLVDEVPEEGTDPGTGSSIPVIASRARRRCSRSAAAYRCTKASASALLLAKWWKKAPSATDGTGGPVDGFCGQVGLNLHRTRRWKRRRSCPRP